MEKYYEVGKDGIAKFGSIEAAIAEGWYMDWNNNRIKGAFAFGHGTEKDLMQYVKINKPYLVFLDMEKEQAYNASGKVNWSAIRTALERWEK